ncbi:MAG: tetratricopeptide repeat protein [Leptolyngbyaceae cyanobacterium SL_7_1]|nr:tetratricopeptide repeat protein [Leptolyngbyaceae cyanobacterium SL_7_1]
MSELSGERSPPPMPSSQPPKSFQDILKQRQRSHFVGREDQVALFRRNLRLSLEDERRRFLFNVWGQGGVGKTTLLEQFRAIALQNQGVTAYIDEGERDIPGVLEQLAGDLEKQGYKLAKFWERSQVYRQRRAELEADPEAPQGFSAFLGRTIAKAAVKMGRRLPVAGGAFDLIDEDSMATQAGEWSAYLAKKLTNKDEVHLLREPVEVLTPLFLEDWGKVAEKTQVTLMFDTYERTGDFLDGWLRELLQGQYGNVPPNMLLVIAGREELDRNRWTTFESIIARLPLEPFSEEEARQYLTRKGITNDRTVDVILNLSGRFPLLLATLAEASPNDPAEVGDPSGTAVERFLKWETNPDRRQVALDAALPRCLNQDVIAQLRPTAEADRLFDWLTQKPFVRERTDGWAYHEVVRTQMLRHKLRSTPQGWAELHGKLADYYDRLRADLELDAVECQRDETWQSHTLNLLYHRLCQAPQKHLAIALNEFLAALKNQWKFAEKWAAVVAQAGREGNVGEVQRWGDRLVEGLEAYNDDRYEVTVSLFKALVEHPEIEPQWKPIALGWRGETYRLMKRYEEALQDFNRAIELDPEYAWAIAHRGVTYRVIKRYDEALRDLNCAIELDPKYDWAIANRGETYRLMKRYEEALQDFDRAIELNPELDWAIGSRGQTYLLIGRYQEALIDFSRAIELDPKDDWWLYDRAITYQALGQPDQAKADLAQAIPMAQTKYDQDPENWNNTFNLALYHLAANNTDRVTFFYRDAIHRGAPATRIRVALKDLEDFLTVFPEHRLGQFAQQFLQRALQEAIDSK